MSRSLEALRLQPLGELSMLLDLFLSKHCVHKDTARYVLSNLKPFELLSKVLACRGILLQSRVSGPTYRK